MQIFSLTAAVLAVAAIYGLWRGYYQKRVSRDLMLRHRVAYMLWTAATRG